VTLVHLLLPYWGDPLLLDQTVASVLAQTDPQWRLTIVDDAYPDLRAQATYADHPDPRITYHRNAENLGVSGNFERCRRMADGDLVVFLGSDDLLLPGYVSGMRTALAAHPDATMIQPVVRVIGDDGLPSNGLAERMKARLAPRGPRPLTLAGEDLAVSLLRGNWLYWPSIAFARDAIARHSFRSDLPVILDLAIIMELVLDGGRLVLRPEETFCYRRHEASASSVSALHGSRFDDERRFYRETAARLEAHGWHRAAAVARHRVVSRLHAVSLLPGAARVRSRAGVATVLRHALSR
jgi:glycosyltransferase involved in cell wall biosynthesis